jgi:hypothetical protein
VAGLAATIGAGGIYAGMRSSLRRLDRLAPGQKKKNGKPVFTAAEEAANQKIAMRFSVKSLAYGTALALVTTAGLIAAVTHAFDINSWAQTRQRFGEAGERTRTGMEQPGGVGDIFRGWFDSLARAAPNLKTSANTTEAGGGVNKTDPLGTGLPEAERAQMRAEWKVFVGEDDAQQHTLSSYVNSRSSSSSSSSSGSTPVVAVEALSVGKSSSSSSSGKH